MARTTSTGRSRKHRAAWRAQGLRPVTLWLPDTRKPGFAEECRRQSGLVWAGDTAVDAWLEASADTEGWC